MREDNERGKKAVIDEHVAPECTRVTRESARRQRAFAFSRIESAGSFGSTEQIRTGIGVQIRSTAEGDIQFRLLPMPLLLRLLKPLDLLQSKCERFGAPKSLFFVLPQYEEYRAMFPLESSSQPRKEDRTIEVNSILNHFPL